MFPNKERSVAICMPASTSIMTDGPAGVKGLIVKDERMFDYEYICRSLGVDVDAPWDFFNTVFTFPER